MLLANEKNCMKSLNAITDKKVFLLLIRCRVFYYPRMQQWHS